MTKPRGSKRGHESRRPFILVAMKREGQMAVPVGGKHREQHAGEPRRALLTGAADLWL
jgi:hypothetical protein